MKTSKYFFILISILLMISCVQSTPTGGTLKATFTSTLGTVDDIYSIAVEIFDHYPTDSNDTFIYAWLLKSNGQSISFDFKTNQTIYIGFFHDYTGNGGPGPELWHVKKVDISGGNDTVLNITIDN